MKITLIPDWSCFLCHVIAGKKFKNLITAKMFLSAGEYQTTDLCRSNNCLTVWWREGRPPPRLWCHRSIMFHYECIIHKFTVCDQASSRHTVSLWLTLPQPAPFLDYLQDSRVKIYLQDLNGDLSLLRKRQQDVLG